MKASLLIVPLIVMGVTALARTFRFGARDDDSCDSEGQS
jgi:hypothetical protein